MCRSEGRLDRLSAPRCARGGSVALGAMLLTAARIAGAAEPAGHVAQETALELEGSWYVLVHYHDQASEEPEMLRWQEHVWQFRIEGERLVWTWISAVVFQDSSGRYEQLSGSDREARTLGAWEPNAAQLEEIRRGLATAAEGARAKSLRGSPDRGYRAAGALRPESASVIGYHETWRVDDPGSLPVFIREDAMGSGRTEGLSGRTRYTTHRVLDGGRELRGDYQRDETMVGSFRMLRMGVSHTARGREASGEGPP